ncbi:MAG: hypothetical protein HGB11_15480 [Chlorobiales bacterium]|nr:hypothetical protein [Chlorobiales bacterium]
MLEDDRAPPVTSVTTHWRRRISTSGALSSSSNGNQNLVGLSALDEDSLGEEIQVVWEIEPGAQVLEKVGLPSMTGWDSTDRLEAFLDAVRWGAVTNADRSFLQAPFRSGITIEDYQLDPLVRAVDMARVNLLIADDVGLGKTIQVLALLLARRREGLSGPNLLVAPASLLANWKAEIQRFAPSLVLRFAHRIVDENRHTPVP